MDTSIVERFLPPASMLLELTGPLLAFSLLAAQIAGWMKKKGIRTPYTRKTFHFLIFSAAGVLQYQFGVKAVTILGGLVFLIVLAAVLAGNRWWFFRALARETDHPHEKKFILLPLIATAAGGILSNLLFPSTAFIGYFVGGWGDAIGEPVGSRWGRHRYSVPTLFGVRAQRSLEGSAAVFLLSAIIATVCIVQVSALPLGTVILWGLICGATAALVESFSSHGLDNMTIQVAAAGVLQLGLAQA